MFMIPIFRLHFRYRSDLPLISLQIPAIDLRLCHWQMATEQM